MIGSSLFISSFKELNALKTVAHLARLHFILLVNEALLALLEALQAITEGKLLNRTISREFFGVGEWRVWRSELEIAD